MTFPVMLKVFHGVWRADWLYEVGDVVRRQDRMFIATAPTMWWEIPGTEAGCTVWTELAS